MRDNRNTNQAGQLPAWIHTIHIHFKNQIIFPNGVPSPLAVEKSRKDVVDSNHTETVQPLFRSRDFSGRYHEVVHKDHVNVDFCAIEPAGDTSLSP